MNNQQERRNRRGEIENIKGNKKKKFGLKKKKKKRKKKEINPYTYAWI